MPNNRITRRTKKMPINYIKGNLLEANTVVIAHQANCQCTFGAGLALAIKKRFPDAYKEDLKTTKGDISKLGTFSISESKPIVANLYGQFYYYPKGSTDYKALENALNLLGIYMTQNHLDSLGLPYKIGCGLGGGDWNKVKEIIENFALNHPNINIIIYEPLQ